MHSVAIRGHAASARLAAVTDMSEGWQGWDEYAPFYDWENARTVARRDVTFWQGLARQQAGLALEPGCGTRRLPPPLIKAAAPLLRKHRSPALFRPRPL